MKMSDIFETMQCKMCKQEKIVNKDMFCESCRRNKAFGKDRKHTRYLEVNGVPTRLVYTIKERYKESVFDIDVDPVVTIVKADPPVADQEEVSEMLLDNWFAEREIIF